MTVQVSTATAARHGIKKKPRKGKEEVRRVDGGLNTLVVTKDQAKSAFGKAKIHSK